MNTNSRRIYFAYKKARRKFSLKVYILLAIWLIIALIQWLVVCLIQDIRDVFRKHYYVCIVTFILSILLFSLFLFYERLRYNGAVALVISFIIVELQIISLFTLVSRTHYAELLLYFVICVVLLSLFLIIGSCLPRKMDLTLHIALLFIFAFLFLLVAVFFLMLQLLVSEVWRDINNYSYILIQIPISITMLLFVMYHAQTISGGRFAEMRLHDYCLGSLILFHDFLIIYWLTFYWQLVSGVLTPKDWTPLTTLWDRNDRKQLPVDYSDDSDDILSNTVYRDKEPKITPVTLDESRFGITQDFNDDKGTESLNDPNWKVNWLAQERRYKHGKRPKKAITTKEHQQRLRP
ncbi:uncharacterized protein LOC117787638 [Drosophila innubila]|uniref:uncharacterized protein LOC117787638 n=1 Tax=Drosophila innubila TaxID=198719 RepID=UPI00148B6F64|nr:uncharacterized protein LOC117787638 [Drosophila innubila]